MLRRRHVKQNNICSKKVFSQHEGSFCSKKKVSFRKIATSLVYSSRTAFKVLSSLKTFLQMRAILLARAFVKGCWTYDWKNRSSIGTYAVAGASVIGVGMLCFYGLGMSKELSAI
uniref:Uncharacterized protein n=1 Tax=Ditylenchus dipsaci TaxID=166011 RepID=A0A915DJU2_9BILA